MVDLAMEIMSVEGPLGEFGVGVSIYLSLAFWAPNDWTGLGV